MRLEAGLTFVRRAVCVGLLYPFLMGIERLASEGLFGQVLVGFGIVAFLFYHAVRE